MGMKRPRRPTESKPGRVFQTGSSPTDSTGIDLSHSYRALGGVGSTSQSSRVQDGVLSVQRREPNDKSKTTAAFDRHDFHQCRPEVCWQIRRQARRRHYCDDGES